ncbi:Fe(3+) ions import ATP-binding protein FbpC [Hypericibacter adhaerens]|uniref:Spermidine/putrescine import ATP-binding protein PotA n=1 Tax=Hypericibacter adhaerens TaxID=2602016 RepID=A0A5J6N5T2_9PROT|nr:Fe(3+) ions import ATP-binding protein FbpC [Hypericibacter adhaerens]
MAIATISTATEPRPAPGEPDVRFRGVSKRFAAVVAVDHVSFEIPRGAFHSFLGPSGCGKTTTLRLIAGFEQPTEGAIEIGGSSVVGVPAYQRPVNMVFQHYALFPHLDVFANIAYGLRQRRPQPARAEIERRVGEALELVRLPGMGKRRIWELSGGQQQRVALARALINRPTVLLLDEPLAALDRKLRRDMQIELQNLQREVGITFILVTHDQEEALSMSDTIGIMRDGRIVQMGPPSELYDAPVNRYVADFVGESNFFAGRLLQQDSGGAALKTDRDVTLAAPLSRKGEPLAGQARAVIAVRPEIVELWDEGDAQGGRGLDYRFTGRVHNRIYLGDQTEFSIETAELGTVLVRAPKASRAGSGAFAPGSRVGLGWRRQGALALVDA